MDTCTECDSPVLARGLCNRHYKQWRAAGGQVKPKAAAERFALRTAQGPIAKLKPELGHCTNWIGGLTRGYGLFWPDGKKPVPAHIWAYEQKYGPVPLLPNGKKKPLDHFACENRACVNPEHVRPVTPRENNLRGTGVSAMNAAKTHCKRGHEFTEENTYHTSRGRRLCRECELDRYYRMKEAK